MSVGYVINFYSEILTLILADENGLVNFEI